MVSALTGTSPVGTFAYDTRVTTNNQMKILFARNGSIDPFRCDSSSFAKARDVTVNRDQTAKERGDLARASAVRKGAADTGTAYRALADR